MHGHPARSVADLKSPDVSVALGADNAASSNLIFAVIAKELLALNVKVVRGYTGAAPLFLAMARGELDGQMVGLSSVRTGQRDLWSKHAFRPLLAFGRTTRHADWPRFRPDASSRPIPTPRVDRVRGAAFLHGAAVRRAARLPRDRAEALGEAFMAMCADKGFREEAQRLGIEMSPIAGKSILQLLARTASTPREVIARYNAIAEKK